MNKSNGPGCVNALAWNGKLKIRVMQQYMGEYNRLVNCTNSLHAFPLQDGIKEDTLESTENAHVHSWFKRNIKC